MSPSLEVAESGLRERKRRETRQIILAKAIDHFRKQGIRVSRLGEIAASSGVSQATLFNYFPNKGALAEAWVRGEIEEVFQESSVELADRGLRSAMRVICRRIAERVAGEEDRAVRLEAWRESGRATSDSLDASHPLAAALHRWQESERVRGDVEAPTMAEMLTETIEGSLIAGLRHELQTVDLAKALRARVDLVLDGARKRNERVAAPAAGRRPDGWVKRPVQSR